MNNNYETAKTLDFVESFVGFSLAQQSRKRPVVEARMMYSKLMKRYTKASLSEIGRPINKDHATIIHYLNNFSWLKKTDKEFSTKFDILSDMYEEYRMVWFNDEKLEDKKKSQLLEKSLEAVTLEKVKYEDWFKRFERLDSIIQLIEERTPKGEEEYVEQKINRMFNSIVFNQ
jgi:hypothetical protein